MNKTYRCATAEHAIRHNAVRIFTHIGVKPTFPIRLQQATHTTPWSSIFLRSRRVKNENIILTQTSLFRSLQSKTQVARRDKQPLDRGNLQLVLNFCGLCRRLHGAKHATGSDYGVSEDIEVDVVVGEKSGTVLILESCLTKSSCHAFDCCCVLIPGNGPAMDIDIGQNLQRVSNSVVVCKQKRIQFPTGASGSIGGREKINVVKSIVGAIVDTSIFLVVTKGCVLSQYQGKIRSSKDNGYASPSEFIVKNKSPLLPFPE